MHHRQPEPILHIKSSRNSQMPVTIQSMLTNLLRVDILLNHTPCCNDQGHGRNHGACPTALIYCDYWLNPPRCG